MCFIREPSCLRHEPFDELEDAIGTVDEAFEDFVCVDASIAAVTLVQPSLGTRGFLGRRKEEERQVIGALEVSTLLLELGFALGVDQR